MPLLYLTLGCVCVMHILEVCVCRVRKLEFITYMYIIKIQIVIAAILEYWNVLEDYFKSPNLQKKILKKWKGITCSKILENICRHLLVNYRLDFNVFELWSMVTVKKNSTNRNVGTCVLETVHIAIPLHFILISLSILLF